MDFQIDMRVTELLASRLCHDLVGPIGAVNNGMELMEDEDLGMMEDALKLVGNSARQAGTVLQYYRLAYGMAGARVDGDFAVQRQLAIDYLSFGKITLVWTADDLPGGAPDGLGKLLLNMIVLGGEMLPRGGTLTVTAANTPNGLEAVVAAAGAGARLREEAQPAFADSVNMDELTPRNVHGYFTRLLAQRFGGDLAIDSPGPDSQRITALLRL